MITSAVREEYERLAFTEAELVYLAPGAEKPRTYCYKLPPGVPHSNYGLDPRRHKIHDARPIAEKLRLDREGFQLVPFAPRSENFLDEQEIRRTYYPEAQEFIKAATKADSVLIFDHTVRRPIGAARRPDENSRAPVFKVHVDNTHETGVQRIRHLMPDAAASLATARIQIINLWRPIRGPLTDSPLALCDARTVRREQLVPVELVFQDKIEETIRVTYGSDHLWLYFPDMQPYEAILLKTYDTEMDGRARFVAHSAFSGPRPVAGLPRESIEVRAIVVTHSKA